MILMPKSFPESLAPLRPRQDKTVSKTATTTTATTTTTAGLAESLPANVEAETMFRVIAVTKQEA